MKNAETKMPVNQLGKGGPLVSGLGLGAMTFGAETDQKEAFRQLDVFVENGGTFIDTADVYAGGMSEKIIGEWGQQRGGLGELVLATKGRFSPPQGSTGASRRGLFRAVHASLKRLKVDAIDVYFVHGWDKTVDIEETLGVLSDLVAMGKIHNIAWSNVSGWQMQKILSAAASGGYAKPVALQPQYNLLERGIEVEVLPCCLENEISITPWSPLGGGWLTGKYSSKERPTGASRLGEDPNRGVEAYDARNTDRTFRILDVVQKLADRHNRPHSHVALAWLASRPGVSSILLGARTAEQLNTNMAAADFFLDEQELAELTQVSAGGLPDYPYRFLDSWSDLSVWKDLGI